MNVVTLSDDAFADCCRRLTAIVDEDGLIYDCMVAIANGGVYVAQKMSEVNGLPWCSVTLQRPTTGLKKKALRQILRRLPVRVSNVLRIAESWMLGFCSTISKKKTRPVSIPDALQNLLTRGASNINVLLVDDAVDSGESLQTVKNAIQAFSSKINVKTAVVTVTRRRSLGLVDYKLFEDCTIVRFPWSLDAK